MGGAVGLSVCHTEIYIFEAVVAMSGHLSRSLEPCVAGLISHSAG